MATDRDGIQAKIHKLLAKAESTTFGPERDALLAKVESLMVAYAISEFELEKTKPGEASKPTRADWLVCEAGAVLWDEMSRLAYTCAEFFNCKSVYSGLNFKGKLAITCIAVGYPEDLRNAEFLFNSLKLSLLSQLEPKADPNASLIENIERMKLAGVKWERQHELFKAAGLMPEAVWTRGIGTMFTKMYSDHCKATGKQHIVANPRSYQLNFAQGFVAEIERRISEIRYARRKSSQTETTASGTSVALVLASRDDTVQDLFKQMFPKLGKGVSRSSGKRDSFARGQGQAAGRNANLGSGGVSSGTKGALHG